MLLFLPFLSFQEEAALTLVVEEIENKSTKMIDGVPVGEVPEEAEGGRMKNKERGGQIYGKGWGK